MVTKPSVALKMAVAATILGLFFAQKIFDTISELYYAAPVSWALGYVCCVATGASQLWITLGTSTVLDMLLGSFALYAIVYAT
jgi:hypothetical protein